MMRLQYIFVHGAGGWGSYNKIDRWLPYWGMFGGSLIKYLRRKGYECYAASVDPSGSIWVRACELYAQIAGTRVDYGAAHAPKLQRERFGRDFTGNPLIPDWGEESRLVLLGHSMGGATVRLLAHLFEYGDEEEKKCTEQNDISPLFTGSMPGRVHSIVTLAAPSNGSTSLDMFTDPDFDVSAVRVPLWSKLTMRILSLRLNTGHRRAAGTVQVRASSIDNALRQNKEIETLKDVYYFSVPCSSTKCLPDGRQYPDRKKTEIMYYSRSIQIGAYTGKTPQGFEIDDSWRENDGLVNTVSARAPIGAPQKELDREHIEKGIWNIFPTFDGDHMSVQGGFFHKRDVKGFYLEMLQMIAGL